jgi:large subunit ribosomal protein L25
VVYGHGTAPVAVVVDARETLRHISKGEKVFTMSIEGEPQAQTVLLKDVGFDYLGSHVIHCDFTRVDLNERVKTRVHVRLIGDAKGLKTAGNILLHPTNEIEVESRVLDIPDQVEVDISELDLGNAITVAQIKLPKPDMKLLTDPHAIVAQVVIQHELKVEEAAVVTPRAGPGHHRPQARGGRGRRRCPRAARGSRRRGTARRQARRARRQGRGPRGRSRRGSRASAQPRPAPAGKDEEEEVSGRSMKSSSASARSPVREDAP